MAIKVGELFALLTINSQEFDNKLAQANSSMERLTNSMGAAGRFLSVGLTAPIVGVGTAALWAAGSMEQSRVAFDTLLGSAEKSTAFIKDLQDFASRTPFEFKGLVESSKQLLAYGFAAEEIIPALTNMGDAMAALGQSGDAIDRIVVQLGQMKAKGKASMMDLRAIANTGVRVFEYLGEYMGVSTAEAMDRIGKGLVDADTAYNALMEGIAGDERLSGMMEKQSATFLGKLSNLKDTMFQTLIEIGEPLVDIAKSVHGVLSPILGVIRAGAIFFGKWPAPLQAIVVLFAALVAAIGPMLIMLSQAYQGLMAVRMGFMLLKAPAIAGWAAALGPITLVVAAIGLVIGAGYLVVRNWDWIKAKASYIWSGIRTIFSRTFEFIKLFFVNTSLPLYLIRNWNGIKTFFRGLWENVKEIVIKFFQWLMSTIKKYHPTFILYREWDKVVEFFKALWDRVYNITIGRVQQILDVIKTFTGGVAKFFEELYKKLVGHSIVPDMVEEILNYFRRLGPGILEAVGTSLEKVEKEFQNSYNRMRTFLPNQLLKIPTVVDILAYKNWLTKTHPLIGYHVRTVFASQTSGVTDPVKLQEIQEQQLKYLKSIAAYLTRQVET